MKIETGEGQYDLTPTQVTFDSNNQKTDTDSENNFDVPVRVSRSSYLIKNRIDPTTLVQGVNNIGDKEEESQKKLILDPNSAKGSDESISNEKRSLNKLSSESLPKVSEDSMSLDVIHIKKN